MDASCMVKPSKTCVKNFQDLPCGREFIDVAVRRLRSQSTVTPAQSTKPNRRERWQASKAKLVDPFKLMSGAIAADPQMSMADMRAVMEHGGDATTEPRGVDYIEPETQRTPGSERPAQ